MVPVELDDATVEEDEEDWAEVELWADSPPAPPLPVVSSPPPQPAKRAAKRVPEKSAPRAIRDLMATSSEVVIELKLKKRAPGAAPPGSVPGGLPPAR
jgi:hypothetical protein